MDFATLERRAWTDPAVARAYEERFRGMAEGAIEPLLDAVGAAAGDRLLDVACGPGRVAAHATRRGAHAVLVDFSPAMLARARLRVQDRPLLVGDAAHLPVRLGVFDVVVCNLGLLHLPDPDLALREAARVLVPGGRAAWTVWAQDAPAMRVIPRALRDLGLDPRLPEGPPFFRFSDPEEFARSLTRAGLRAGPPRTARWRVRFASGDEFLAMFLEGSARTRAGILALEPRERDRLFDRVRRDLEAFTSSAGVDLETAVVIGSGTVPG